MYRYLIAFILLPPLYSQWFTQNSGTVYAVKSVHFINHLTGYGCATNTVLKTTNGGDTWGNHYLQGLHNSITFVNNMSGYICGDGGRIYKTTDSGQNWILLNSGTTNNLNSVEFFDNLTGVVCGNNRTLLKTTNGGNSWINIANFVWQIDLFDIKIQDVNNFFISGSETFILKTSNGGINWYIYTHSEPNPLFALDFITPSTGFATGCCGMFMMTTNHGLNWTAGYYLSPGFTFYCMQFLNQLSGFICGDNGMIYRTTNGGSRWDSTATSVNATLYSLFMINENTGWASGSGGTILKTTNGGGQGFPIGVSVVSDNIPSDFELYQNYPNPFNPVTTISFDIPRVSFVRLSIYDAAGREIDVPVNQILKPGKYRINWYPYTFPSGVYFYTLKSSEFSRTNKMIIIR
jgi:photosystem II stability/assembly factor-like uncharacterized protein